MIPKKYFQPSLSKRLSLPLEVDSATGMQLCWGIPQHVDEEQISRAFPLERKMQSYGHLPLQLLYHRLTKKTTIVHVFKVGIREVHEIAMDV